MNRLKLEDKPHTDPESIVYLYGSPRSLTFSLNEDVIKRAIDRDQAKLKIGRVATPWLGGGMAFRANRQGIEVVGNTHPTNSCAFWPDFQSQI